MAIFIQAFTLIILLGFIIYLSEQFFNLIFRGFAPFLATKKKIIKKIIDELNINNNSCVYELGCGRAGFLKTLRKRYPKINLLGFEYALIPYLIARIQNSFLKTKLEIRRRDIFKVSIEKADIIYCYLNIKTMEKLAKKFKQECRSGCVVISYQFPIPGKESFKTLEINKNNKIYFYRY